MNSKLQNAARESIQKTASIKRKYITAAQYMSIWELMLK